METVIALPLYLLLIGGIMWEGQLIFDKQKMVVADRYAAWNLGNRWRSAEWNGNPDIAGNKIASEIQGFFYGRDLDEIKVTIPSMPPMNGWVLQASAGMGLTAHMPEWTEGFISAGVISYGAVAPETNATITGRDTKNLSGIYLGHTVFMRAAINPDPRTNSITPNDPDISKLDIPATYKY